MQSVDPAPKRALEFGIYRDGDNNLDASQAVTLGQALKVSQADTSIDFTIEDTTSQRGEGLQTFNYGIANGAVHDAHATIGAKIWPRRRTSRRLLRAHSMKRRKTAPSKRGLN